MTEYACLTTEVLCPACGHTFENTQGHIRFRLGRLNVWYKLGDAILWDRRSRERERLASLSPLYAFDCDDDYNFWECGACSAEYDSPIAVIESGHIAEVRLLTRAQLAEQFGFDREDADIVGRDVVTGRWIAVPEER